MRYDELKQELLERFESAGIESARVDAELLLQEAGGISRTDLLLHADRIVPADKLRILRELGRRRAAHEPLQYLLGKAYFMNLELRVTPDVLIPRPETELLVEWVVGHLPTGGTFLDLGTGSGAIALSVKQMRPDVLVTAVDVSVAALEVARLNAAENDLMVEFLQSDLFDHLAGRFFDVIAANLPYVTEEEYETLQPEVRLHEPKLALTAPDDGFALIARAVQGLGTHLNPEGRTIWELSPHQAERLRKELTKLGYCGEIVRDYCNRERFVTSRK